MLGFDDSQGFPILEFEAYKVLSIDIIRWKQAEEEFQFTCRIS